MSWPGLALSLAAETHAAFGFAALYYPGGQEPGLEATVLSAPADEDIDWSGGRVAARGDRLELRALQVPLPQAGDEIQLAGSGARRWRIKGTPKRDSEGTAWLCDVTEIAP